MLATKEFAEAPWVSNPFGLVSLKEILALMTGSDDWPTDRIIFGPLTNALWALGRLEAGGLDAKDFLEVSFTLENAANSLETWRFVATCRSFRDLAKLITDHAVRGREPLHGLEAIPTFIALARQTLMQELEAHAFLPIDPSKARYYLEPTRDWDEVIKRFPGAVLDIEEAGRCFALERHAAAVFHCMQILEHGLLALGEFMQLPDPKSGFTAVSNALQRIKEKKHVDLSDFEREHLAFFEQMNGSVQALKDAWRNKITHAQGKATLMTADFSHAVAEEIYFATRGFMRRFATELPKAKKDGFPWIG